MPSTAQLHAAAPPRRQLERSRPARARGASSTGSPARLPAPRPGLPLLLTEPWRAAHEYLRLRWPGPAQPAPRGDGHPVILFPGLASDGLPLAPLRAHCEALGYAAQDWGLGLNTGPAGDPEAWLRALSLHVQQQVAAHGQPVSLIGWSLGGLYARELAKLPGLAVRQVITIGTPFNGTPEQTHAAWVYRLLNGAHAPTDAAWLQRLRQPPPVPTTSIYSRNDGIVAWQACCHERQGRFVQDIEVQGSHLGMGWNPEVLRLVADRLAQPAGHWRRHRPSPAALAAWLRAAAARRARAGSAGSAAPAGAAVLPRACALPTWQDLRVALGRPV